MRPLRQFSCLVLLICLTAVISSAQKERTLVASRLLAPGIGAATESGLATGGFTLRTDVNEVEVHFVAVDRSGQPVPSLEARDVKVITDGRYSPDIKSFRPLRATPITLGILVDLSESVRPEMHVQVVAFSDAISQVLRPQQDREFVVAFSNRVSLLQAPTSDFMQVKKTLEHSKGDHNLTSLYDAIVRTCRDQFGAKDSSSESQRVLLLFTDGVDNLSIHSLDDAVGEAQASGVVILRWRNRVGMQKDAGYWSSLLDAQAGRWSCCASRKNPISRLPRCVDSPAANTL